jgi:hypothetical protein
VKIVSTKFSLEHLMKEAVYEDGNRSLSDGVRGNLSGSGAAQWTDLMNTDKTSLLSFTTALPHEPVSIFKENHHRRRRHEAIKELSTC